MAGIRDRILQGKNDLKELGVNFRINISTVLKEISYDLVDRVHMVKERVQWRIFMCRFANLRIP